MAMTKSEINKRYEQKKRDAHPYKTCSSCNCEKLLVEFDKKGNRTFSMCKTCRHQVYVKNREENLRRMTRYYHENSAFIAKKGKEKRRANKENEMFKSARARARRKNIPFTIVVSDIFIPEYCPVLGIKLIMGDRFPRDESASLDRIIPKNGYIPGNVMVISHKANSIKRDATKEELMQVALFYQNYSETGCVDRQKAGDMQ